MEILNRSMTHEIAFEMAASSVRFGVGVTREVGMDLADLGIRNVLVITDPILRRMPPLQTVIESLRAESIAFTVYDRVRIEPNDISFQDAIGFAERSDYGAIVAVGGGSTIDTAKAVNLYTCYPPEDFLDYVNSPIGKGLPVPGPLKPLIAIPTTAGTGSETTGVSIFDLSKMHAKTGIASRRLKPTLGLLDPENTRTMPAQVAAATGLDVLCHAVESYTAIPFSDRPLPDRPLVRPAYQGSNPISDVWSLQAMRMVAQYLVREVEDPSDDEARANMMLASCYAGIGFGNAGVHLPHGMSYPVSGMVKGYFESGYPGDHPLGIILRIRFRDSAGHLHGHSHQSAAISRHPCCKPADCSSRRNRRPHDAGWFRYGDVVPDPARRRCGIGRRRSAAVDRLRRRRPGVRRIPWIVYRRSIRFGRHVQAGPTLVDVAGYRCCSSR
jgi:hydroxyacid-oxoacid transhydrogenase